MTDQAVIDVRGVQHAYTHSGVVEPVLHGIDLSIQRGEFVVVMGPSGCGKSTLLNIVGLMMPPTGAERVRIAGVETLGLADAERTRLRRESIGFVFQRFNLLPTISAWRNVALPLRIRGVAPGLRARRLRLNGQVEEVLERIGLAQYARKKPGHLSVGQQQRVAIARALVGRPAILLADEPTGNLDSANAEAILALLAEFHREWGQTILMITHNESVAVAADRVLHMRDGRLHP
jgi:putative ABC transport system ATP-binding protein